MVQETQDHRTRLADRREPSRPHNPRFRAGYRHSARRGGTEGINHREDPEEAGDVFGGKRVIKTDFVAIPVRTSEYRELLQWEHEWK